MLILSVAVKSAEALSSMSAEELAAYQLTEAAAVQNPYVILALILFAIAGVFAVIKLPVIEATAPTEVSGSVMDDRASAWKYPHLVLGAIGIFVYVGAEVSIGSFLVNFLGEKNIAGLAEADAGKYVSFYWGGAMIGRFIGAAIMQKLNPGKVLGAASLVAALLVVVTMLSSGSLVMWLILSVGLFNSIMWSNIFTLAIQGLKQYAGYGSSLLVMMIAGGAILPLLQGFAADQLSVKYSFIVPFLAYLYLAWYGRRVHKPEI